MENVKTTKVDGKEKVWTPNDTQKEFMNILKQNPDGITMKDIELNYGKTFKTGSTNTLISKGYVDGENKVDVECQVVYKGEVIGTTTKHWTVYKLTDKGLNA